VVDVVVMGPNRMKKKVVEECEDVVEKTSLELDENNDWIMGLNDFHCSDYDDDDYYLISVHNDLAYLLKSDIWSPLYLCLSTQCVWRSFISG
jgi:hypothetical protein